MTKGRRSNEHAQEMSNITADVFHNLYSARSKHDSHVTWQSNSLLSTSNLKNMKKMLHHQLESFAFARSCVMCAFWYDLTAHRLKFNESISKPNFAMQKLSPTQDNMRIIHWAVSHNSLSHSALFSFCAQLITEK